MEVNINEKPQTIGKNFFIKDQNFKSAKYRNKKTILTFTTNSKATVKFTQTSVTAARLTKT